MKASAIESAVFEIEKMSRINYPAFYVSPTLLVSASWESASDLGILYARTIPVEVNGRVLIIVQLSAPLVLFATKAVLLAVMAHEFLHYLELVKRFAGGNLVSELSPNSLLEEKYEDATRTIDPSRVFPKRSKIIRRLAENFDPGFSNQILDEKCRKLWIEKGLPTEKILMGANQIHVSMDSLARSSFDPAALKLVKQIS